MRVFPRLTGYIGQVVSSVVARTGVSLSNATAANVASISLTAGDWDVSGVVCFAGNPTGTFADAGVNTTSATLGTLGDNYHESPTMPSASSDSSISIPPRRFTVSSGGGTAYLVARVAFSGGSVSAYGRIQAVRVVR